jgi:TolB protein
VTRGGAVWMSGVRVALAAALLVVARVPLPGQQAPSVAKRSPLLPQVNVPHGYYWREMYVPQPTSGPSGAAWSPDDRELVYAMQGSLWRQRVGSTEAVQLTNEASYAAQPDWSPDGRYIAFTSYDGTSYDLKLVEVATGDVRVLLANSAVNLEPRWSPDGSRLAYVSTAYEGRWHVFVANVRRESAPKLDTPTRITEDKDSGLPRYYYSVFDHYLSPTWSPDGQELIVVSNRGHVYGTGGFWRMEARNGAPMRELHYEETTWKARPDWSPDGKRVVYSGYQGRQWNQLSLTTADGGDPIQLTYGDFDATAPRWSHDGKRIAYVSNEGGNTALWTIALPGGKRERIDTRTRTYRGPVGRVVISAVDSATGAPIPARLSVRGTGNDRRYFTPDGAWRHGDEALIRDQQQFEYGYFHIPPAGDTVVVPAGRVLVEGWHGPEFSTVRRELDVPAGSVRTVRVALAHRIDLPARGWWGGDVHVHMNYGGAYRNTPAHLALQARAEGLHVVENLIVNKEQRIPDIAYWSPKLDAVSTRDFILAHGQEYHTGYWGHSALLGLRDHYVMLDYAGYPLTAAASLVPTNADVFDLGHAQGAIAGYVHPFDFEPDISKHQSGIPYELPIDVALGKVDYLEVMGYSDPLITSSVWYRLLNLGFKVPAAAGTDAFPNFSSLRGPPGLVRVYAKAGATLDHARWLAAIKAGRTFVTNAPVLGFTVGGKEPGDEIALPARGTPQALEARVRLTSPVPVDRLEIIGNGRVVASIPLKGDRTRADTTIEVPVSESAWFVLRAYADGARLPVLDLYPFASTSPVYVQRGSSRQWSAEDAAYFLRWIDQAEDGLREFTGWNTTAEREAVMRQFTAARAVLRRGQ